jgi:hypothetical protein
MLERLALLQSENNRTKLDPSGRAKEFLAGKKCLAVLGRQEIWQLSRGARSVMFKLFPEKREEGEG